ncbi:MAG: cobyrinate a,c-diamide synthase [Eubacteriales bacterium]|nr:cobyrinate a,c-diamide synthase [Eubacteriales bacterium]
MKRPGIMIAAPKSGSGKTTITCALLEALNRRGLTPCAFKCGPDYIDPMFHRTVIGIPSGNLDRFFTDAEETRRIFRAESSGGISVIEGVMGLYDGLGGIREEASTYALAETLGVPVILVVDARGAGRSLLAEISGFLSFDRAGLIRGVILNRTTPSFANMLKPLIEETCHVRVLGSFPMRKDMEVGSRHLGLAMPSEIADIRRRLGEAADCLEENCDIDGILKIAGLSENSGEKQEAPAQAYNSCPGEGEKHESAGTCGCLDAGRSPDQGKGRPVSTEAPGPEHAPLRLGIARDGAFCFYYRENLEMLERAGFTLVPFSPVSDERLPDGLDGLLLGGGYPELCAEALSKNEAMLRSVRDAVSGGIPVLAECGGFMYLCASLVTEDGSKWPMAGVFPGEARWTGHLTRFGYVTVRDQMSGLEIRGHEFHYFDTDDNGDACLAVKPVTGRKWPCMHRINGGFAGFPHLYYPSAPAFVTDFAGKCRAYRKIGYSSHAIRPR